MASDISSSCFIHTALFLMSPTDLGLDMPFNQSLFSNRYRLHPTVVLALITELTKLFLIKKNCFYVFFMLILTCKSIRLTILTVIIRKSIYFHSVNK